MSKYASRKDFNNAVAEYKVMALRAVEKVKVLNSMIKEKDILIGRLERRLEKYEQ